MSSVLKRSGGQRVLSLLLCLAIVVGFVPAVSPAARAEEEWMQPYLEKLVNWGIMRGDQAGNLDPNRSITRAEFVSMINRAYGYTQSGPTKFDDVPVAAWYYDDIGIAARAGYFAGTSESTASPEALLTREQATVILSRNLLLQNGVGEALGFVDTRELSDWSRGLVKTATEYGMVKGYPDGTFRPQNNITRGEVASLLCSAIGTPINQPGTYSLGYTYGNVTISASDTILKDTVIAGDLYLTGGVGLGNVTLENVTVLGKIIAGGAGESNKGDASILLRNVSAPQMLVDNPGNQFVTIRSEGNTQIANVSVRTPAYLEDITGEGLGLKHIELNGEAGTTLQVAGNIKEVVNLTPNGHLTIARGSANLVTMDEKALGGALTIEQGGLIKDLRLDVATNVGGKGDVDKVTISAGGSTITMMPDNVIIRPGITANVSGETMNTVTADEASMDPHVLAGYPRAYDIAPASAGISVGGNKAGTIYWAVSALSDGSVEAEELIKPPTYGSKIIKSGSVKVTAANQEFTASATGLTSDGSYYISAVLVDSRGQQSPVKISAFGTPDDTVPAFATGYPYLTGISDVDASAVVMTTKSCRLFYAVLPKGAAAPKEADFKAAAITGNLGYGSIDMTKSESNTFVVNSKPLEELKSYDLYLWLNDVSGAKSSAVTKLSFTTVDKTPPTFVDPTMTKADITAVTVSTSMNEDGTIFWAVVPAGAEYPKPLAGSGETGVPPLNSMAAKIQVANGSGAFKSGKQTMTANKDGTITISGLEKETAYDLYCIAQDKAGNYAAEVKMLPINTLDNTAPTAAMSFTKFNGTDKGTPTAETDIEILFSERVQDYASGKKLDELYKAVEDASKAGNTPALKQAKNELGQMLNSIFTFSDLTNNNVTPVVVRWDDGETGDWVVDYRNAKVVMEGGKTKIILPYNTGLRLRSGSTYQIKLQGLCDSSRNIAGTITFPNFTTVFAQVNLKETNVKEIALGATEADKKSLHLSFEMTPVGTKTTDPSIDWDMIIWTDTSMEFTLYTKAPEDTYWSKVGNKPPVKVVIPSGSERPVGVSVTQAIKGQLSGFDPLNILDSDTRYEYGIVINSLESNPDPDKWNKVVNCKVNVVAGSSAKLGLLVGQRLIPSWWNKIVVQEKNVTSIGRVTESATSSTTDTLNMNKAFSDTNPPVFAGGRPTFKPSDLNVDMSLMLDRTGTVYYTIAPVGDIITMQRPKDDPDPTNDALKIAVDWKDLKTGGDDIDPDHYMPTIVLPTTDDILENRHSSGSPNIKWGKETVGSSDRTVRVDGLLADTQYIAYFVIQGTNSYSPNVLCYTFKTKKVVRPILTVSGDDPTVNISADRQTDLEYMIFQDTASLPGILGDKLENHLDDEQAAAWAAAVAAGKYSADYTVLEALVNDVKTGTKIEGSVFDYYANQDAKNSVAGLIRRQSTGGSSSGGKESLMANVPKNIDLSKFMAPGQWYCFLAVGKSVAGEGSGDAFRGYRPLQLKDTTPPVVTSCNTVVDYKNPSEISWGYSGMVTLVFSEPLYVGTRDPSKPNVLQKVQKVVGAYEAGDTPADKDRKILVALIFSWLPGNITVRQPSSTSTGDTTVLVLDVDGARVGDSFVLRQDICDAAGMSHNVSLTATLMADAGGGKPKFVITPAVWNSTGT